ncbi:GNAT family N-acetyltransferase [Flavobacterium silvaticum]|uniref:GNAT family N-acetyltransferase n=1 Tax=Flavobacterium silvaticum TaxID=1852020 RepID=A0A972JEQ0_9FLAO|nr:GNAT family protein [Flavobacterium silvaticum]NMH27134.1 GNAT family N-acetyltransferase [Flavobacterium silvaticum]
MSDRIEIQTPRLLLKSVTPSIITTCFENNSQDEIKAFFGVDQNGFDHLKNMYEKGMETHRLSLFYFLLHEKNTDRIIGECGFHTLNKSHHRAELFYSLRQDSDKRNGFMTEALKPILDFGFNQLGLHRIEALTAHWNIPSLRTLGHFNFTFEGTMREDYVVDGKNEDSQCYSLLKWEHEKHHAK